MRSSSRCCAPISRHGLSGNYDVWTWHAWGDTGDATYFANPADYVPRLHDDHLD